MATTDTKPKPSLGEIHQTLNRMAAEGIKAGEAKGVTIGKMIIYLEGIDFGSSAHARGALAESHYEYVKNRPGLLDRFLADIPDLPGQGALEAVAGFVSSLSQVQTWIRVGLFTGGLILVVGAIVLSARR